MEKTKMSLLACTRSKVKTHLEKVQIGRIFKRFKIDFE
jgi:hypothetical protein